MQYPTPLQAIKTKDILDLQADLQQEVLRLLLDKQQSERRNHISSSPLLLPQLFVSRQSCYDSLIHDSTLRFVPGVVFD